MATTVGRRELKFDNFEAVGADVDALLARGYSSVGKWDLSQTCDHLTFFIKSAVEGANFKVNWLLKTLFGKLALRRILSTRQMKEGIPAPKPSRPDHKGDDAGAVSRLKEVCRRFDAHKGEYQPSPFFGAISREQWRDLMLIHCAHHLSFLKAK